MLFYKQQIQTKQLSKQKKKKIKNETKKLSFKQFACSSHFLCAPLDG